MDSPNAWKFSGILALAALAVGCAQAIAAKEAPKKPSYVTNAGELFKRIRSEMAEEGIHHYDTGPWYAGLAPFPAE